jgi:hypothetical protein
MSPHKMARHRDQLNNNYQIFKEETLATDWTILFDSNTISFTSAA